MYKKIFIIITIIFSVTCVYAQVTRVQNIPMALQVKTQLVSVASTATALPTTALVGREYVLITNTDTSVTVYIGSSTVTATGATSGTPLGPSESVYREYSHLVVLYGIVSSGSANVIVEEGK